jgi:two-component system sensor histidine kinase KdpD
MNPNQGATALLWEGARLASTLAAARYAVYVESAGHLPRPWSSVEDTCHRNVNMAEQLGAIVVKVVAQSPAEWLTAFAEREGVSHVVLGQAPKQRERPSWRRSTATTFLDGARRLPVTIVLIGNLHPPSLSPTVAIYGSSS